MSRGSMLGSLAGAVLCGLLAAGCAGPERRPAPGPSPSPQDPGEPLSERGNHSPYRVLGKTYHVLPTARGYVEDGIASWYGEPFHGRPTSNQEIYDMHKLTAAHKSLPLPTYAEVTNLENGRSVVVRVNDRGPFKDDRIIDLSFAAARELGMVEAGTALVQVKALVPEDTEIAQELVVTAENLYLQLGAFSDRDNALALVGRLRGKPLPAAQIVTTGRGPQPVHRVRIGPLADTEEADRLIAQLLLLGLDRPVVVFE